MSTVVTSLTHWDSFVVLPDAEYGYHYELHDGEVVSVPPPRPIHVYIQSFLVQWLTDAANGAGRAAQEFPYRPAKDFQFWYADVAYIPNEHWEAMRADDYPIYAPPLVIEVLSPSNKPEQVARQRAVAFLGGTEEFWVVDPKRRTVEVWYPESAPTLFEDGSEIPVNTIPGATLPTSLIFHP